MKEEVTEASGRWRTPSVLRRWQNRRAFLRTGLAFGAVAMGLAVGDVAQPLRISNGWIDAIKAGADPTGKVDSARFINAALLAAAGKRGVFVPAGSYLLKDPIAVPSHSILVMSSATTLTQNTWAALTNRDGALGRSGDSDIRVHGGTFRIAPSFAGSAHIRFTEVTNLRVSNVTILGVNSGDAQALLCQNVSNAVIDHVNVDVYANPGGRQNNGIWIQGGNNITITHCRVRSGDDAYAFGYGTVTGLPFTDTDECYIKDCYGESRKGRVLDIETANDHNVFRITADNISGKGGGVECINIANYSNGLSSTHTIAVSNCVVDPSRTFVGVQVDGATDVDVTNVVLRQAVRGGSASARECFAARTTANRNTSVSRVNFTGCMGETRSGHYGALQIQSDTGGSADGIRFDGCKVRGGSYGVRLGALSTGSPGPITNSIIHNCDIRASEPGSVGVFISAGVSDCEISNNRIRASLPAVRADSTADRNRWIDNDTG